MGSTATQMTIQCAQNPVLIRADGLSEHQNQGNKDAIDAVTALRCLGVDERLINNRAHFAGDQVLNRVNRLVISRPDRCVTRLNGLPVQRYRTSPAVAGTATKPRSLAVELVTHRIQQC